MTRSEEHRQAFHALHEVAVEEATAASLLMPQALNFAVRSRCADQFGRVKLQIIEALEKTERALLDAQREFMQHVEAAADERNEAHD